MGPQHNVDCTVGPACYQSCRANLGQLAGGLHAPQLCRVSTKNNGAPTNCSQSVAKQCAPKQSCGLVRATNKNHALRIQIRAWKHLIHKAEPAMSACIFVTAATNISALASVIQQPAALTAAAESGRAAKTNVRSPVDEKSCNLAPRLSHRPQRRRSRSLGPRRSRSLQIER